jgi:hypothetical protein
LQNVILHLEYVDGRDETTLQEGERWRAGVCVSSAVVAGRSGTRDKEVVAIEGLQTPSDRVKAIKSLL